MGGKLVTQILEGQLTLSQPEWADCAPPPHYYLPSAHPALGELLLIVTLNPKNVQEQKFGKKSLAFGENCFW